MLVFTGYHRQIGAVSASTLRKEARGRRGRPGGGWFAAAWRWAGVFALALAGILAPARMLPVGETLTTSEKRELRAEARLVIELLQNLQYADRQFHELEGSEIVTRYLDALDPDDLILTRRDTEFLHRRFDRTIKAVYLLKGDLEPAYEMYDFFAERARRRLAWIDTRLDQKIDLTTAGTLAVAKEPAADDAEADQRWEARLKDELIAEMLDGRDQPAAVAQVKKLYRKWGHEIAALDALAVRQHFFDGLINLFDPHSGYFSSEQARDFQIMMQGAVVGVGLGVRLDDGKCLIDEVTPGGPADLAGVFEEGDEILALSDDGKTWRDVAGLPLRKIVADLRGEPKTKLSVAFRSSGGPRREAALTRAEVVLAGDRARGGISEVPGEDGRVRRIGWILLPDFYAAEPGKDGASATRDVRELIDKMKKPGIDALVLDLRGNPGGAMTEAVGLSGLFLPSGVVTIMRGLDGQTTEQKIEPAPITYGGPLVVLTSARSASASEMFSGAMRCYRRAVVVGAAATFGKGTAQDFIDLNKLPVRPASALTDWGMLRVTRAKFYFPDGHSPQRDGVPSDIVLSLPAEGTAEHEADLPHALANDTIETHFAGAPAGDFARLDDALLKSLREQSEHRAQTWPEFALERRRREFNAARTAAKERSVQLEQRQKERAEQDAKAQAVRQEMRELVAKDSYRTERLRIAAVQAARDSHEKSVRAHLPAGVKPADGWLQGGYFRMEDADGKLRELSLASVDFRRYHADAAELAKAFASASGAPATREAMETALQQLNLLEERTDEAVLACLAKVGDGTAKLDPAATRRGGEAVLRRLIEIDPGLVDPQKRLDVVKREGLRIAADWAARMAPAAPKPENPPPAQPAKS